MSANIPFNEYEVIILHEAFLKTQSGELTRPEAVKDCSKKLRIMAYNSGLDADSIFRTDDGINAQMTRIEAASGLKTINDHIPKLFLAVVSLYKNKNKDYVFLLNKVNRILKQADDSEANFKQWLKEQVLSEDLVNYYAALQMISRAAKENGLITRSLYAELCVPLAQRIKARLKSSMSFKFYQKDRWNYIVSSLDYIVYYAENETKIEEDKQLREKEILDYLSTYVVKQNDKPVEKTDSSDSSELDMQEKRLVIEDVKQNKDEAPVHERRNAGKRNARRHREYCRNRWNGDSIEKQLCQYTTEYDSSG